MNYDMQAIYGIVIFFAMYTYLRGTVKLIDFCTQFQIVRLTDIDKLRSQIDKLEHDNNLLRRGIFITKEDSGQLSFDMPTEDDCPMITFPPLYINGTWWQQRWRHDDWINFQNNKTLVKRGKKYVWVDEVLARDTIIKEPFEWIKVYNNGHHTRKVRVR